jgi:hypothetical protein
MPHFGPYDRYCHLTADKLHFDIMRQMSDTRETGTRARALPAVTLGLAAILGLQTGVCAGQPTSRANRNTAIMSIAAAPAPISILDTDSLLIWTAATLAVMLLMSRQARTTAALLPIMPRTRSILRRSAAQRDRKASISYRSGGLYGP